MSEKISVSSADFVRSIGVWQERALHAPVAITYHGRERLVLIAAESFAAHNDQAPGLEAADQLAVLIANMAEGFIAIDEHQCITALNHVAESYFGRSAKYIEGQTIEQAFPGLKGSLLMNHVQRVMRMRESVNFETDSVLFPGRRLECRAFPLLRGVGMVFSNVTEREALRSALSEAEALKNSVLRHPEIAHATCDARGRITQADARFCNWLGFDPQAILQSRFVDILAPVSRRTVADALERALERDCVVEARLLTKDLNERPLTLALAPIMSLGGAQGVTILATQAEQQIAQVASRIA